MQPQIRHNSTPNSTLSPVQAQVAEAVASGLTLSAAARKFSLHRATIHNWINDNPHFQAEIDTSRQFYRDSLRDQLAELSLAALARLHRLLEDPNTPPAVALRAALAVLNRPDSPGHSWALPSHVNTSRKPAAAAPPPPSKPQPVAVPDPPARPVKWHKPCPCGIGIPYKLHCGKEAWLNYQPGQPRT